MTEFEEIDVSSLDLSSVLYVANIRVAKAELFVDPHECQIPEHKNGSIETVLALLVTDVDGKESTLVFPVGSTVARDILSGTLSDRLNKVVQTC